MEQYKYRLFAKVVAVNEVILAVIYLLLLLALSFGVPLYISTMDDNTKVEFQHHLDEYGTELDIQNMGKLWIFTVPFGIGIFLMAIAACKLLKATRIGAHPGEALFQAKFWRVVTVVMMCLAVVEGVGCSVGLVIIFLLVRGVLVYAVSKYIAELEGATTDGNPNKDKWLVPPPAYEWPSTGERSTSVKQNPVQIAYGYDMTILLYQPSSSS